ncbi:MAG: hypothetical protein WBA74_07180 [Cyclobacteriaceae bacterium]
MLLSRILPLTIGLLGILSTASAQTIKTTYLSQPDISLDEIDQGIIYRELGSALFAINDSDTLYFFDPAGKFMPVDYCIGRDCVRNEMIENRLITGEVMRDPSAYLTPLVMEFREDRPATGEYTISVRNNTDNKPRHLLKFNVVYPQPKISSLQFIDASGKAVKDTLILSSGADYSNWRVKINGSGLENGFGSVKVGKLELSPTIDPSLFTFDKAWSSSGTKKPGLGTQSVVFNRKVSDSPASHQIYVKAAKPKILGSNLEIPVEEGQSRVKITLTTDNIFEYANVILYKDRRAPLLLASPYAFTTSVDPSDGSITFEVLIQPDLVDNTAYFRVAVKNIDQTISSPKTIRLVKKSDNIKIVATDAENKPLVAGILNYMKIKRINGAVFSRGTYKLLFEDGNEATFTVNNADPDVLTFDVLLPANLTGNDIPVLLIDGNDEWKGTISRIRPIPKISWPASNTVLRDSEFKILVRNATDTYLRPGKGAENEVSVLQPDNKAVREFTVYVGANARNFDLQLSLFDHTIETIPFTVTNHPTPQGFKAKDLVSAQYVKEDRIILNDNEDITLKIPVDGDSILSSTIFYAQLYKKNGLAVRKSKPLKLIEEGEKQYLAATLNTQIGLEPGEEFDLEISNPDQESITINSYIRREGRDNWIATAGLSAIDYRFGKTDEEESRVKVLDGVNIGVYYMPENLKNPTNRNLGIGFNLLLVGTDDSLDFRLGASALFFEKVVLGLSAGKGGLGFLAGVNIQLSSLAGLTGSN